MSGTNFIISRRIKLDYIRFKKKGFWTVNPSFVTKCKYLGFPWVNVFEKWKYLLIFLFYDKH